MSPSADDAAPPSPDTDRETARGSEGPASERAAAEPARPARHRLPRPDGFERRRVVVFALFAFGIAWSVGGVIAWTGGLRNSPQLVPGLTLGTALLASGYMFAPAVAHLLTRLLTGEGFTEVRSLLRPRPARWRVYVLAWLAPAALTLAGAGLFFAAFPRYFDPALSTFSGALPPGVPLSPWQLVAVQLVAALTVGPAINTLFAFGEEFGWRAYLLPKLLPLGPRRAVLALGVVWGVWHWPVIGMGYNYGFGYPGSPWTGMAAMVAMTTATGTFLAWVTLRERSVWPAALGHGAINAVGAVGLLFSRPGPPSLFGPTVVGLVAVVPWALVAVWLLSDVDRLDPAG